MAIHASALEVIQRKLDPNRVKQRPGRGSAKFDYIPTDYAIELLNEAFGHEWDSTIMSQSLEDSTVIVRMELSVPTSEPGVRVRHQQFGSCDINKGVGVGDAFKGAASDALKKCATHLGVALELYQDDSVTSPTFTPPHAPNAPSAPSPQRPATAAPRPPAPRSMPPAPKVPESLGAPARPAAVPLPPSRPTTAAVPRPAPPAPATAPVPRPNPFDTGVNSASGPNATQLNALSNLSEKKSLSQPDMIAKAVILDTMNNPKLTFEELTHSEAIQVIKAAQQ